MPFLLLNTSEPAVLGEKIYRPLFCPQGVKVSIYISASCPLFIVHICSSEVESQPFPKLNCRLFVIYLHFRRLNYGNTSLNPSIHTYFEFFIPILKPAHCFVCSVCIHSSFFIIHFIFRNKSRKGRVSQAIWRNVWVLNIKTYKGVAIAICSQQEKRLLQQLIYHHHHMNYYYSQYCITFWQRCCR